MMLHHARADLRTFKHGECSACDYITRCDVTIHLSCRLRIMMKMHGLGDFAYYSVQYLWYMCLYILYIIILLAVGSAVNIGFFRDNGYGLQIVRSLVQRPPAKPREHRCLTSATGTVRDLPDGARALRQLFYFVWGNCMVSLGFMASTFFTNTRTAVVVGEPVVMRPIQSGPHSS